eukprot:6340938-Amphidinium_carterae.2
MPHKTRYPCLTYHDTGAHPPALLQLCGGALRPCYSCRSSTVTPSYTVVVSVVVEIEALTFCAVSYALQPHPSQYHLHQAPHRPHALCCRYRFCHSAAGCFPWGACKCHAQRHWLSPQRPWEVPKPMAFTQEQAWSVAPPACREGPQRVCLFFVGSDPTVGQWAGQAI